MHHPRATVLAILMCVGATVSACADGTGPWRERWSSGYDAAGKPATPGSGAGTDTSSTDPSLPDSDAGSSQPGAATPDFGVPPDFGGVVTAASPPPAISGGTLAIRADGSLAAAADTDGDVIHIVRLATGVVTDVALQAGDEPGRVVFDDTGHVHVVLRGSGKIATIDVTSATLSSRRDVCAVPRGIAWDATRRKLWVACMSGELVAVGDTDVTTVRTDLDDARDVTISGSNIYVSHFRRAGIRTLTDSDLDPTKPTPLPKLLRAGAFGAEPVFAFRTVGTSDGGLLMLHEQARLTSVPTPIGYYSGTDSTKAQPLVQTFVTRVAPSPLEVLAVGILSRAVLAVDINVVGTRVAVVAPGNANTPALGQLFVFDCASAIPMGSDSEDGLQLNGQAIAVAQTGAAIYVQTREPAALLVVDPSAYGVVNRYGFSTPSRRDTGHDIFHSNSGGFIACASCHAEGGDDGLTFNFGAGATRRTQSLRGGAARHAPYHWAGDEPNFDALMHDVFTTRMSGVPLTDSQRAAALRWLSSLPYLPPTSHADPALVAAGKAVFERTDTACGSCHSGPDLSNHTIANVGTGGGFKIPSLRGVRYRAPYLHDGCAATLLDRFDPACGGGDSHGKTSGLAPSDTAALVAYLQSL